MSLLSLAEYEYEFFLKPFYAQKFKRYPLLFLALKDNNNFSYCSFVKKLPPPTPSVDSKLMHISEH